MIRTSRPTSGNKYFITKGAGGYSTCIQGKPTDSQCNVLSNCVGYACGAFNEETNLGYEKYHLNCNAENFIERAIASGLSVVSKPCVGAIICWQKGATLSGGDGAGHVAIVIEVINDNCIRTAESGYGSSNPFWISTRYNNNGRWGLNSDYKFRGFIVNPNYPYNPSPTPTPTPTPSDKYNIGDKVVINGALYVSSNASSPSGSVSNKVTNITRKAVGSAHPYNTTGDLGWMNESDIQPYKEPTPQPTPTPTPTPSELKVGDKVKIVGTGNGSSYGDSNTAYGIGWEREILKIWSGRPFPYQVGNSTGTTGFYKASALEKK